MNTPNLLQPTEFSNPGLAERFEKFPGPYAITGTPEQWKEDMENIFPGIMDIEMPEFSAPAYGEMNESERELVYRIATWQQPKVVVEFGTFHGTTTKMLAEQTPSNTEILTVDLPEGYDINQLCSTDRPFYHPDKVGENFANIPERSKIKQYRMDATSRDFETDLDFFLNGRTIDLALVDAAHDYETTFALFHMAFDRMSEGGIIVNDDYNKVVTQVGVTNFFTEMANEEGYLLYYFKPDFGKDPSAVFHLNVPGSVRDWKQ